MVTFFVFSKGKLISRSEDLGFLKVVLYEPDVQVWVDAQEPTDEEAKMLLQDVFDFHPLAVEDCVAVSERPKIEDYEDYLFMVIHSIDFSHEERKFRTTELNMFIGKNFLVTYHRDPLRSVTATIERVMKHSAIVARAPDRLTYHVLDLLLDNYEPALSELSNDISELEKSMMMSPSTDLIQDIVHLKTQVQGLRQIITPQREVIARLAHGEFKLVRAGMLPYYRDLSDRLSRITDSTENYREALTNALQVLLNLQQYQTNQVIKVLTVLATLSLPILAVTSFYGMNVQHMPNTEWPSWPLAYAWILGLTLVMTAGIYWFLRRKRWM